PRAEEHAVPRLREVSRREATAGVVLTMYDRLFGDKDPVEDPGTRTGTPGNWWTVYALVPDILEHAATGFSVFATGRQIKPALRELGQIRAGWARGSKFVFSQHCKAGRR